MRQINIGPKKLPDHYIGKFNSIDEMNSNSNTNLIFVSVREIINNSYRDDDLCIVQIHPDRHYSVVLITSTTDSQSTPFEIINRSVLGKFKAPGEAEQFCLLWVVF